MLEVLAAPPVVVVADAIYLLNTMEVFLDELVVVVLLCWQK